MIDEGDVKLLDVEIKRTELSVKTILLVGLTGSGKSRFLNIISGKNDASSMSAKPISHSVKTMGGIMINDTSYNLIDTIGLGDPEQNIDEIIREIKMTLFMRCPVQQLVFVFIKMDRLRAKISNDMNQFLNDLEKFGMTTDNVKLIITFKDWFSEEVCKRFYESLLHSDLHPILKRCEYVFINTVNIREVKEEYKKQCLFDVNDDVKRIIYMIEKSKAQPFIIKSSLIAQQLSSEEKFHRLSKWFRRQFCCWCDINED